MPCHARTPTRPHPAVSTGHVPAADPSPQFHCKPSHLSQARVVGSRKRSNRFAARSERELAIHFPP